MKLVQYLKPLSDIAFLYCTFGTLIALIYPTQYTLLPLVILAFIQLFGYLLQGKGYRYVALLPALVLLPWIEHYYDGLMPLGALVYLFLALKKAHYNYNCDDEGDRFTLQLKILVAIVLMGYVFGIGELITQYTMPYLFIYLVSSNLLLRMLKADSETMASPSFVRFNLMTLVIVLIAAVVVSSEVVVGTVVSAVAYLYQSFVVPLVLGILSGILWVINWIYELIAGLFGLNGEIAFNEVTLEISSAQDMLGGEVIEQYITPQWLETLGIAVVVAIVLAIFAFVLHRMLGGRKEDGGDGYVTTVQSTTTAKREGRFSLLLSPRDKVRKYYLDFMTHASKRGIEVTPATDTAQLEERYGPTQDTAILRERYCHARYDSSREVSKTDVAQAKQALKEIKSQEH